MPFKKGHPPYPKNPEFLEALRVRMLTSNPAQTPEAREKIRRAKWKGGHDSYMERSKEKRAEGQRQWQKANKELCSFYSKQYQRRKKGASGTHTLEEWKSLITSFGGVCANCSSPGQLEADHIIPLSKGGTNHIWNIQPLCRSCNARKHAKIDYPEYAY